MSAMTFFYQECPVCGRSLRVAVKYFGKPMSCSHCGGEFRAGQTADTQAPSCGEGAESREVPGQQSGVILDAHFGAAQLGKV